jgi:hypothetical protein
MRNKGNPSCAASLQGVCNDARVEGKTLGIVVKYFDTGIEEATKSYGLNDLLAFLQHRNVIDTAKAMLERLCFLSAAVHGACVVKLQTEHKNFYTTRMFLTAYMLHFHVNKVFSILGSEELNVIKSARLMLDKFDEMALIIKQTKSFSRVPADLAKCFNTALVQYFSDFEAWDKMAEESRWPVFRSSLVSLYFTYFYHSKEGHPPMRTVILSQISQLREKTVEKYGQRVLDGFDDELREGKFGMPPIHTSRLEALDADPKFFILRNADHTQLVHELGLDVNYRQDRSALNESPIHVHVTMSRNDGLHWNTIHIELLSFPQIFTALHATFTDFKRQLRRVVDEGRESWVDECLDMRTLQGTGWDGCVAMVRAIMSVVRRIQMPVRRKETDAGWKALEAVDSPGAMIDAVRFVYDCLKTAEIDAENLNILLISREFNEIAPAYMAGKLKDMLDKGVITMERTQVVWSVGISARVSSQ